MSKISSKQKTLTMMVLLIGSFFVLLFFVVIPLTKKVYQQKDKLEETKLTLERDRENVGKYKDDLEYLRSNDFLSKNLVVNEDNRIEFVESIEKIAAEKNLNLEIEAYTPVAVKNEKNKADVFLKMTLTGKYDDFIKFLYKLENFQYQIVIQNIYIKQFDEAKIKSFESLSTENLPEIEGKLVISF